MKQKLLVTLMSAMISASAFADCTDELAQGRKILHLGDELTQNGGQQLLALEQSSGADMAYTRAYAPPFAHTLNGTSPFFAYDPANPTAQPYLLWNDVDQTKPTYWQYLLETQDSLSLSNFDGAVVALGTFDTNFFSDGGTVVTPTTQWKANSLDKLINWLQPNPLDENALRVILILPHFTKFPNGDIPDGAYNSGDPHKCFFTLSSVIGAAYTAIEAAPEFCADWVTLDELPNDDTLIPSQIAAFTVNGITLDTIANIKTVLQNIDNLHGAFATTAEIQRRAEGKHQVQFKIRQHLQDLEKTHPHLYVASDPDAILKFLSDGQDSLYNHLDASGDLWGDQSAADFWANYQSYLSKMLSPGCRNESLSQLRSWANIQEGYDDVLEDHVLHP